MKQLALLTSVCIRECHERGRAIHVRLEAKSVLNDPARDHLQDQKTKPEGLRTRLKTAWRLALATALKALKNSLISKTTWFARTPRPPKTVPGAVQLARKNGTTALQMSQHAHPKKKHVSFRTKHRVAWRPEMQRVNNFSESKENHTSNKQNYKRRSGERMVSQTICLTFLCFCAQIKKILKKRKASFFRTNARSNIGYAQV